MSQFGTTLADAAKAYKEACEHRDRIQAVYRDVSEQLAELLMQQEQAQVNANRAAKFLRLVALHGPVEDWGRDYMADEQPVGGSLLGSSAQRQAFQNYRNPNLKEAQ